MWKVEFHYPRPGLITIRPVEWRNRLNKNMSDNMKSDKDLKKQNTIYTDLKVQMGNKVIAIRQSGKV